MNRIFFTIVSILMTLIPVMAQQKIIQTAGRQQLGDFALSLRISTTTYFSAKCGAATTSFRCATAAL